MPSYAQVPLRALTTVEDGLGDDDEEARKRFDGALKRFESTQPALANRVSRALNCPIDETALALGYFLTLSVWLAFDQVFRSALDEVTDTAVRGAEEALRLDEQIDSRTLPRLSSRTKLSRWNSRTYLRLQEHIDAALEANANSVNVDDVHAIYEIVLIEVLALSYAVQRPSNWAMLPTEFTA